MEQREIEIFLTLAEELHFGRTAERLLVSPARISQTIKKLEQRIGAALFERTSRQVALTTIGKQLRDDLKPAHEQILEGVQRAIRAGRGLEGQLRVGFIGPATGQLLFKVAGVFEQHHPNCRVEIRENQFSDGHDGLLGAGEIDMLLATFPVDGDDLAVSPVIFREDKFLAVSARHPFTRRNSIAVDDLALDQVLRPPPAAEYWDRAHVPSATSEGRPILRGQAFSTIEELMALVGAGQGVYLVPAQITEYGQRPDVAYVPIRDAPPYEWGFIWQRSSETRRIRAFIEVASALPR